MALPSIIRWLTKPGDGAQIGSTATLPASGLFAAPAVLEAPLDPSPPPLVEPTSPPPATTLEPVPAPGAVATALPTKSWLDHFNEANSLHQAGHLAEASRAYRLCYEAGHPYPAEALSSSLLCLLKNGEEVTPAQMAELCPYDQAYTAYIGGAARLMIHGDAAGAIEMSGNAFETFHTGTEPDVNYLRAAVQHFAGSARPVTTKQPYGDYGRAAVTSVPNTLVFYWDKNPPSEVSANFDYHRGLGCFDVQVYSKQIAEAFLYDYFGRECRKQFTELRHPAEEADYFRAHVMYAYGGVYLDADLKLRSAQSLAQAVRGEADATMFVTDGMLVHNDLIVCAPQSKLMSECIRVITSNCAHFPGLGIVLKTGPGAFTRAVNRLYFRRVAFHEAVPSVRILNQAAFDQVVECYPVSYKQDARHWGFM